MMRQVFVSDVVKELLGPRGGPVEQFLEGDEPRNEYSTGQLFPQSTGMERSLDSEDAFAANASEGEEDSEENSTSFVNQAFIDAGQSFRRVPSSMGLSFVLSKEPNDNDIRVCVTWGRYRHSDEGGWVKPK